MTTLSRFFAIVPILIAAIVAGCTRASDDAPSGGNASGAVGATGGPFTEARLGNGLRVILMETPGSGLVCSNVFIRAGAVRETEDLNGAAHFLEHLLFNGTTSRTQQELYDDVDLIGGYNNATTRMDYAAFIFVVGSESAEKGLAIQADMLFNSTLPPDNFEKERGIVLEEIAKDVSDPTYQASLAMNAALYAGTPYALPVLGTPESIRGLDREKVLDYYRTYYVPSNMTMMLLGDFESDEMMRILERTFGSAGSESTPPSPEPLPALTGVRRVDRELEDTHRRLTLRVPAPVPADADYAALELLADVLGRGEGSRLRRALDAEPRIAAEDVGCGLTLVGGRAFFDVSARVKPDVDPDLVTARLAGELVRIAGEGVTESELRAAKVSRRTEEAGLRQQLYYYGFMRGELVLHAPPGYLNQQSERYRAVTLESARRAAGKWLRAADALSVCAGPGLSDREATVDAGAFGFAAPAFALAMPEGAGGQARTAEPPPPPRTDVVVAPRMVTLGSGLRVVLTCDDSSDILALHLMGLGRSYREPAGLVGITDFLHRLLERGAGAWNRTELTQRLNEIGATVKATDSAYIPYDDYYTAPEFSFVRFETLDDYYREAFELLAAMAAEPHLDEADVEAVRAEMRTLIQQRGNSPRDVGYELWRKSLHGEDSPAAREVMGDIESIDRITRDDLRQYHASYFHPDNLVLTVVTSLPEDVAVAALEEAFRADRWPTPGESLVPWSPEMARPPLGGPAEVTRKLEQAQSWVTLGYPFGVEPEDGAALEVAGIILSDRMAFQLRERQGLAYSIGASFSSWADRGVLSASMGTRPENLGVAVPGIAAQIDSMAIVTLEPDDVTKAVNARVGRMRMRRVSRMGQAYYLSMDVLRGEALLAHERRLRAMQAVGVDDVHRVAGAYFDSKRAYRVIVE